MDPALLRERDAFKKKAMSLPTVEKRRMPTPASQPSKRPKPSQPREPRSFDYKQSAGSSSFKFSVLAKIVNYMKQRHQHGDMHPLEIDEILDETNQLDCGAKMKHWLASEALPNNPKIDTKEGSKFMFKPAYHIPNKKKLLRLLDKNDQEGLGGILFTDVEEAMPNAAKGLKNLGDSVLHITRPTDKKLVLFYNDKGSAFPVDDEFRKLWRGVAVEGIDERKIEEHLQKHGIASMQDLGLKKIPKRKKGGGRRGKKGLTKSHNEHMGDILEDYSNKAK